MCGFVDGSGSKECKRCGMQIPKTTSVCSFCEELEESGARTFKKNYMEAFVHSNQSLARKFYFLALSVATLAAVGYLWIK